MPNPNVNTMRSAQDSGKRFKPYELNDNPVIEQIIDLYHFRKWPAKRVVDFINDPKVTTSTVYGTVARFRKKMKRLDRAALKIRERIIRVSNQNHENHRRMAEKRVLEAGEYQGVDHLIKAPPAVEQGPSSTCLDYDSESADLELPTEDVFALAKDDPTSVSTAIDLAQLRKKHQEFLLLQASLGSEVVSEAGRAALVSVRERDAELAAKTVTTWDKSIKAFKALAGLDDGGSGGQQQGGLHLHQHLHSANNPFG